MERSEHEVLLNSYLQFADFLCRAQGLPGGAVVYALAEEGQDGRVLGAFGTEAGRQPGDPLSPFIRSVCRSFREKKCAELTHVDTEASTAGGRVKLSIFPVRDGAERLIGLFVISTEIDLLYGVREAVNRFLGFDSREESPVKITRVIDENFSLSNYMQQLIREEIAAFAVPVARMTMEEKRQIIHRLEQMEVFYMKDSVRVAAGLLGVSVPTVYRLLKKE